MKTLLERLNNKLNDSIKSKIHNLLLDKTYLEFDEYMYWLKDVIDDTLGGTLGKWEKIQKADIGYSSWSGANVYEAKIKNKKGKIIGKLQAAQRVGPAADVHYYFIDTINNDKSDINYNDYGRGVVVNKTNEHTLEDIFNKINK